MALAALSILLVWSSACRALVPRHYEYDEQIDLSLDGSASIFINGSVPAIIALRGIPLDPSPSASSSEACASSTSPTASRWRR